jgi:hypothetical protein
VPPVTNSTNTIEKALSYFSNLGEAERTAFYTLRCAFAHDYSLYNINNSRSQYTHQFAVGQGTNRPIVTLPQQPWDGKPDNRKPTNQTTVNLEAFCDLVEEICQQLFSLAQNQGLEVVLAGGSDELLQRYSISYRFKSEHQLAKGFCYTAA